MRLVSFYLEGVMEKKAEEITFKSSLNPNKNCIRIDGDGASTLTLTQDAQQLAKVLSLFRFGKNSLFEVRIRQLEEDLKDAGPAKGSEVIR